MNNTIQKDKAIEKTFDKVVKYVKNFTDQEAKQSLVDAGIITEKGNVRKPYRKVFVRVKES